MNLANYVGNIDPSCTLCHVEDESCVHFFFNCTVSRSIWFGLCRHPNLYQLILMVLGLSDDNLRSHIRQMCVENHPESSRKRVREAAF
jgi:hypothetical protein